MASFLMFLLGSFSLTSVIPSLAKILATVVEASKPLMEGAFEFIVWFVKAMWEGFKDVIDSVYTILFVLVFAFSVFLYADRRSDEDCRTTVAKLERQIAALRKNPVRTVNPSSPSSIFEQIFGRGW